MLVIKLVKRLSVLLSRLSELAAKVKVKLVKSAVTKQEAKLVCLAEDVDASYELTEKRYELAVQMYKDQVTRVAQDAAKDSIKISDAKRLCGTRLDELAKI